MCVSTIATVYLITSHLHHRFVLIVRYFPLTGISFLTIYFLKRIIFFLDALKAVFQIAMYLDLCFAVQIPNSISLMKPLYFLYCVPLSLCLVCITVSGRWYIKGTYRKSWNISKVFFTSNSHIWLYFYQKCFKSSNHSTICLQLGSYCIQVS